MRSVCLMDALRISLILGRTVDRHTRNSYSTEISCSRFLFFMFVSGAENPCSRRYEVENGNRVVSAFVDISGYSSEKYIQNLLKGDLFEFQLQRVRSFLNKILRTSRLRRAYRLITYTFY